MNNILKKFATFLGAVIMAAGLFQGALWAKYPPPDDALTTDVKAFANYYTANGTIAFQLELFTRPEYKTGAISLTSSPSAMRVYFLGATAITDATITTGSPPGDTISPSLTIAGINSPSALTYNGTYSYLPNSVTCGSATLNASEPVYSAQTVPYTNPIYSSSSTQAALEIPNYNGYVFSDSVKYFDGAGSIVSSDVNDNFRYFDLTTDGLPGFWLGASMRSLVSFNNIVLSQDDPLNIQHYNITDIGSLTLSDAWNTFDKPRHLLYVNMAFLFGPEPAAVPEPQVYLLLGTLLAGVGLVAYRRRQKA